MMKLQWGLLTIFLLALWSVGVEGWKCHTCKDIVSKFKEGLKKTQRSGFGGGNTHWEEKSLGAFVYSETRLIEIIEGCCEDASKECHMMIEEFEEDMETWWFKYYAKKKKTDLYKFLCVDKIKACCAEGTYGPLCLECRGGKERPCSGNGNCDGDGTREGKGTCSCNSGYKGEQCEECAKMYYQVERNTTHTTCAECHASCGSGCEGPESRECDDCAEGWDEQEDGCFDIDECAVDQSPCKENEFCTNTEGSFSCTTCHPGCDGCTGAGVDKCAKCSDRYYMDDKDNKCKFCHIACKSSCQDGTTATCDECKEGWQLGDNGCEDINECITEAADDCEEDNSFCHNTLGSYKCSTCHAHCNGCIGMGSNKCKACKAGYRKDDKEFCNDIDECTDMQFCTEENAKCVNLPGAYRCECQDGFIREGDACIAKKKKVPTATLR